MPLTQHEVVSRLGISRGTLHRVLTNSPLVKRTTKDRVLAELAKLDYTPNFIARGLKTRKTNTIGIIGPAALKISNIEKVNSLFLAAREQGYSVIFGYTNGSAEEDAQCIRELRARMVDGFVTLGRGLAESVPHYNSLVESKTPLVTLYPMPGLAADCVHVDTRQAFQKLTEHLIGLGHSSIGLLLEGSSSQYSINRELGYRDAMEKAAISINEDWIIRVTPDGGSATREQPVDSALWTISDYQAGFLGTSLILSRKDRPTALVCFSDEFAIGALRAADLAKVSVPKDLALVGYDDNEPAKFARVPLTTMHQPDAQLGREAMALLMDRINGTRVSPSLIVRPLQTELVIRDSCGSKRRK